MDIEDLSNEKIEEKKEFQKCYIRDIKSDFFIERVFNNLSTRRKLVIIKYNKKTQNCLNIKIYDYKQFSENKTSIIIEIIPIKNDEGEFIKKWKEDEESYYHIYFDDDKIEKKRNYLTKNDKVSKIKIIIDYQIKSFEDLFLNCKCIEKISFKHFYRNNISSMKRMFFECSSLKQIDFFTFNTTNITNMSYMFCNCRLLSELDLSKFNTSKVKDMSYMFWSCSDLYDLNITNFDINNLINTTGMFFQCSEQLKIKIREQNPDLAKKALC
jgi:surface protein